MKLLKSNKFKLPTLYFISNRDEISDLPIGIPFIYGDKSTESHIVRILEYEVLYQKAVASGYPFNFKQILTDEGYTGLRDCSFSHPVYMDYVTSGDMDSGSDWDIDKAEDIKVSRGLFDTYIRDTASYIDISKLKELNIIPIWLDTIEDAITTNIHRFATFNPNMYNKKLGGMYGAMELSDPGKNLIIIDISGSIPKGVSSTCLALAKHLVETFYADLIITGTISTLYNYEEIGSLDIDTIYETNGLNNDQTHFKNIVTKDVRKYRTAIVFGDNHSPCYPWQEAISSISREDGRKMCQWSIDKLISFHTSSTDKTAGYADWFTVDDRNVEKIADWVKYL